MKNLCDGFFNTQKYKHQCAAQNNKIHKHDGKNRINTLILNIQTLHINIFTNFRSYHKF